MEFSTKEFEAAFQKLVHTSVLLVTIGKSHNHLSAMDGYRNKKMIATDLGMQKSFEGR